MYHIEPIFTDAERFELFKTPLFDSVDQAELFTPLFESLDDIVWIQVDPIDFELF